MLEQMTFNLGALTDSLAGGNNYVAGEVYEVFNIGGSLAVIYSDSLGTSPITQDGISNVSNADGEVNFYIDEGVYYFEASTKRRDFTAGLGGKLIVDLSQAYIFDTVAQMASNLISFSNDKVAQLMSYHTLGGEGGGYFYWDSAKSKALHNGGSIIDPDRPFPLDWTNQSQLNTWFTTFNGSRLLGSAK